MSPDNNDIGRRYNMDQSDCLEPVHQTRSIRSAIENAESDNINSLFAQEELVGAVEKRLTRKIKTSKVKRRINIPIQNVNSFSRLISNLFGRKR